MKFKNKGKRVRFFKYVAPKLKRERIIKAQMKQSPKSFGHKNSHY